jgi:hypothetical protein
VKNDVHNERESVEMMEEFFQIEFLMMMVCVFILCQIQLVCDNLLLLALLSQTSKAFYFASSVLQDIYSTSFPND